MSNDQIPLLPIFRVWVRSVPGFYEQYRFKLDVFAEDERKREQRRLRKSDGERSPTGMRRCGMS